MSSSRLRGPAARSGATLPFALLLSVLAGCGFQLQGSQDLPAAMATTYVATSDPYSPFYQSLRRALLRHGVRLADSPQDATGVLTILRDETGQRVLSVSAQNVPREYEVYYTVSYDLRVDGVVQSGADDLTLTRDYTWSETQVLGKEREEAQLREALVENLVATVLRRLSYSQ